MKRISSSLLLFLILVGLAFAEVSITGTQTRGIGTNGKLQSTSAELPKGGVIVKVLGGQAGFWLESSDGNVLRFSDPAKAMLTSLPAGTWSVYPNLNPNQDRASVSVDVRSGGLGQVILMVIRSEDPVVSAKTKSLYRSLLPIIERPTAPKVVRYDFSNPRERLYCENTLGIVTEDLPFVGVAECPDRVPERILFRVNSSADADLAVRQILDFLAQKPAPYSPSAAQRCCSVSANPSYHKAFRCREVGCNCSAFTCATPQLHGSLHGSGGENGETCASLNCTCECGHLFYKIFVPPPNYDPTKPVNPKTIKVGGHTDHFWRNGRP